MNTPRTAYVQVQTFGLHGGSGGKAVLANGGIVKAYANGGMTVPAFAGGVERHIP